MGKIEKKVADTRYDKCFNLDDLVRLGDQLHNCDAGLVVTLRKNADDDGYCKAEGTICGDGSDLIMMLVEAMKSNESLEQLLTQAVMVAKVESVRKFMKNNG